MSTIIPFQFDDHAIRTVVDLGFADTVNALKQHCRGVVKRHPIVADHIREAA